MGLIKQDPNGPCPAGECDLGWNRDGIKLCKNCGYLAQQLVDEGSRHPLPGDYRVVCNTTPCPIGPSEATQFKKLAIDRMNAHQRQAVEEGGEPHDVEIVQFPVTDDE